jgi:DNA mismatch repair protein MutL
MGTEKNQPRIQRLPNYLIDQIKAGEVIESPTALLKELLENAIDAKPTFIEIEIEDNGINKLLIKDNGHGMSYDELPLAFDRHATSKIKAYDDLYNLFSFGFRGEALASAASISRLQCVSVNQTNQGGKITIEGGKIISHTPIKLNHSGTTIVISDLFFNTPVRMKFIKGQKSERKSLNRVLHGFILSNPHIHFSIKWDEEEKKQYPPTINEHHPIAARVVQLFSWINSLDDLIIFTQEYDHHKILGIIEKNSTRSTTKRVNYLFANNRLFTEQSYHYLITQNCKKIWKESEQGSYIIFLEVPTTQIDVNVHPSKTRLKFEKAASVYALISSAIKNNIHQLLLNRTPQVNECYRVNEENQPLSTDYLEKVEQTESEHSINESTPVNTIKNLVSLNESILAWRNNNDVYLLTPRDLFLRYLYNEFSKPNAKEEIPLLITQSLKLTDKNKQNILFLKKYGILLEEQSSKLALLRALPKCLIDLPVKTLIEKLISIEDSSSWENILPQYHNYNTLLSALPTDKIEQVLIIDKALWYKINYESIKL